MHLVHKINIGIYYSYSMVYTISTITTTIMKPTGNQLHASLDKF
jgi:hypothetical protein